MIQKATAKDVEALVSLWQEAFDEEEGARDFYATTFDVIDTIVYRISNEIVSMLHYIPFVLHNGTEKYNGAYLYALATKKEHRGKKIMQELMNEAQRKAEKEHLDVLFVIPASEQLYGYYEKMGYCHRVMRSENGHKNILFCKEVCDYIAQEKLQYGRMKDAIDGITGLVKILKNHVNIPVIDGDIPY